MVRLFLDTAAPDLHLQTWGHYAANAGLDLSAEFSTDIDGGSQPGTWDVGADEAVTGTELLDAKVVMWREVEP